ncbi:unnamed protein product [Brassica oleracea var. botrytis]
MEVEPDPAILGVLRQNLPRRIVSKLVNRGLCSVSIEQSRLICSRSQLQAAIATEPEGDLMFNYDNKTGVLLLVWSTHDRNFTKGQGLTLKAGNRLRKHVGKVRDQHQHLLCWAYSSGDLVSSARIFAKLDNTFEAFCPWYLATHVEPQYFGPNPVPDPEADQDHYCYESSFETAFSYFRTSDGVPREPKGQEDFICRETPRSAGFEKYKITFGDRKFKTIEDALMHVVVTKQPVGAELLGCDEMWEPSMKKSIYKGPLHQESPICCYHSVVIEAVEFFDGEWVAVCKLSNGFNIGREGFLYVSLRVRYMLISAEGDKASHVRNYQEGPQFLLSDFICLDTETQQVSDTYEPRRLPIIHQHARKRTRLS